LSHRWGAGGPKSRHWQGVPDEGGEKDLLQVAGRQPTPWSRGLLPACMPVSDFLFLLRTPAILAPIISIEIVFPNKVTFGGAEV
jgi:hypothetical protein